MQEGNKSDVKIGSMIKSDFPEYLGKMRSLVHERQGRGFVTHRDIERHVPVEVWDPDTLDNILSNLQELGIEVVEEEARSFCTGHLSFDFIFVSQKRNRFIRILQRDRKSVV